jgi:hypothetical protein
MEGSSGSRVQGQWVETPWSEIYRPNTEPRKLLTRTFSVDDTIVVWPHPSDGSFKVSSGDGSRRVVEGEQYQIWFGITTPKLLSQPQKEAWKPNTIWHQVLAWGRWDTESNSTSGHVYSSSQGSSVNSFDFKPRESSVDRCTFPPPPRTPSPPKPDPPPRNDKPRDRPVNCNCRNIEALLRKIYLQSLVITEDTDAIAKITGCEDPKDPDLPADIENLIDDDKTKCNTIPELLAHMTEQLDGVLGQFPVEIKIKDTDPLTAGDQEEEVKIPNIAEFLCELYAQQVDLLQNAVLSTAAIPRIGSELVAIKNTAIQAEAYARCNSGYLGYQMEFTELQVPYAFDTEIKDEGKAFSQFLSNTTGKLAVPIETDKTAAAGILNEMKAKVELLSAVNTRKPSQIDDLVASVIGLYAAFNLGKSSAAGSEEEEDNTSDEMKKLLRLINDSDFFQTSKDAPRPKATKIPATDIKSDMEGGSAWG